MDRGIYTISSAGKEIGEIGLTEETEKKIKAIWQEAKERALARERRRKGTSLKTSRIRVTVKELQLDFCFSSKRKPR